MLSMCCVLSGEQQLKGRKKSRGYLYYHHHGDNLKAPPVRVRKVASNGTASSDSKAGSERIERVDGRCGSLFAG